MTVADLEARENDYYYLFSQIWKKHRPIGEKFIHWII